MQFSHLNNKNVLTEKQLIKKIKRRDELAIQQFYNEKAPELKYILFRYVANESIAEDLLQDGFILLINKIHQFKHKGAFMGWVKRMFTNLALQYLRNNKKKTHH